MFRLQATRGRERSSMARPKRSKPSFSGKAKQNSQRQEPARANRGTVGEHPAPFPVVGVGASAGGIEAFTQLLQSVPVDTGMAFVLIQHLDPSHASMLTDIFSRVTAMPVKEVRARVHVYPDHVYVIPPASDLKLADGYL